MVIHSDERNFTCNDCDKTFKTTAFLKRHSLIHLQVKPYFCDECGKSFADPSYFKCHKKEQHSGSRPFECSFCAKGFKMQKSLKLHLKTHSSDFVPKPRIVTSDVPKRTYTEEEKEEILERVEQIGIYGTAKEQGVNRSVVRSWVNVRGGKYKCEECERCFKDSHLLKMHIFGKHTKKNGNYNAHSFDNKFRESVVEYVREHSMEEASRKFDVAERSIQRWVKLFRNAFTCNLCQIVFNNQMHIRKHLKKRHKIVDREEQENRFTHMDNKHGYNVAENEKASSKEVKVEKNHENNETNFIDKSKCFFNEETGENWDEIALKENMKDDSSLYKKDDTIAESVPHSEYSTAPESPGEDALDNTAVTIFMAMMVCLFKCILFCMQVNKRLNKREIKMSEVWEEMHEKDDANKDEKPEGNIVNDITTMPGEERKGKSQIIVLNNRKQFVLI